MFFVVTGCSGFIGYHVTKRLLERGHYVVGIDKLTYASSQFHKNRRMHEKNFIFVQEDIKDLKKMPDCDYVINFAAESHVDNSIEENNTFINSNVVGVQNLLKLCAGKYRKPVFFQISTDEVYGEHIGTVKEETDLNPGNPYAASKASAEMLVKAWNKTYKVPYLMVRPSNNYGPEQYPEKLFPKTIKSYLSDGKIELHDEGKPIRTWLHVDDTWWAIYKIIESKKVNEIYNISSPDIYSNLYIVSNIFEHLNKKYQKYNNIKEFLDYGYSRPGQDIRYNVDDTKLKSIGWDNSRKLEHEMPRLIKEYVDYFEKYGVIF